jgi:hypothetical protein
MQSGISTRAVAGAKRFQVDEATTAEQPRDGIAKDLDDVNMERGQTSDGG